VSWAAMAPPGRAGLGGIDQAIGCDNSGGALRQDL
jgi:hypothetical protein